MPATVTHVRMPDSNRVPVSSTLRTHAIWRDSVGYDPYAPQAAAEDAQGAALRDKANELLVLARLTGNVATKTPGACPKCGQVGHLGFQCRNMLSAGDIAADAAENAFRRVQAEEEEQDDQRLRAALGIASDSEESAEGKSRGLPKHRKAVSAAVLASGVKPAKKKRTRLPDDSSSSSSNTDSSEDERTSRKKSRRCKPDKTGKLSTKKTRRRKKFKGRKKARHGR